MPTAFSRAEVLSTLKQYWGFDSLRPIQEDAIRAALDGRDSLVVMPTGGGKSLCYQLPPLLTNQLTVVVSPLIALMKDQVDGLRLAGYPAAAIHSNLSDADTRAILSDLDTGTLRLLFLAPERLLTTSMLSRLARIADRASSAASLRHSVTASLSFAIDEAHCISQWGHDFRPEYRRLAQLREVFPGAPFHAFTATATGAVQQDIVAQLKLKDPAILVGPFDRPNLIYRVLPRSRAEAQCAQAIARHSCATEVGGSEPVLPGATIIYCISRQNTEDLAGALRALGIDAQPYHAGLDAAKRRRVQDAFASEQLDVVVATVAFGMGIDRSNVRCVIHAAVPKSVEHYQQETGRAGRDGLPAECILLYSPGDASSWRRILTRAAEESGSEESLQIQLELLARMERFASTSICRHKALAAYFGQPYEPPPLASGARGCNACDTCLNELSQVEDATTIARKILSCVARVNQSFGAAHIADILRGSNSARITERRHDQLSTYGLLRKTPRPAILSYINQLIEQNALQRAPGEYPVLTLTESSLPILRGEQEVTLLEPRPAAPVPSASTSSLRPSAPSSLSSDDSALFDSLRRFRYQLAKERSIPPYLIFHDTVLRDMARLKPTSLDSMRTLRGVGDRKLADFGQLFADHIAAALASMP